MLIKEYNIDGLRQLNQSGYLNIAPVIPITGLRAFSQVNNPRADINDIVLIVAYDEDQIAGYIGILPDNIFLNGKQVRAGWISCWWTDPMRGRTIALELFYLALEKWSYNILITDMIPKTKFIIGRTGEFFYPLQLHGLKCFLRPYLSVILPSKSKFFKRIDFALYFFDFLFGFIITPWLKIFNLIISRRLKKWNIRTGYAIKIDNEINDLVMNHNKSELTCRGKNELEWIRSFPWLSNSGQSELEGEKYYFSSYCKMPGIRFVKVYRDNKLILFMMTSQRDDIFKVPYIYFDKSDVRFVVHVIYKILIEDHYSIFTTFNIYLIEYMKNRTSCFYYKRKLFKDLAVTTKFQNYDFNNLTLQDGDGDCAFT